MSITLADVVRTLYFLVVFGIAAYGINFVWIGLAELIPAKAKSAQGWKTLLAGLGIVAVGYALAVPYFPSLIGNLITPPGWLP